MKKETGNLIGLIVVTIGAGIIMLTTFLGVGWIGSGSKKAVERAIPPTPVVVFQAQPEHIEITDTYAGMLRPFERYALGFEIAGRIESFGVNADGKSLDDGDYVTAGQSIAQLDQRLLNVQMREARAKLEQAQSDMNRANELKGRSVGAMSEAEYQKNVTNLQLAQTAEQLKPPVTAVGLIDGEVAFTNIAYLYDLMDMQERRPRQQWWLELQQIADVVN